MLLVIRWGRRRWKLSAENISAAALVFGLACLFDPVLMELRIIYPNGLIILSRGPGIGGHNRLVMVKI